LSNKFSVSAEYREVGDRNYGLKRKKPNLNCCCFSFIPKKHDQHKNKINTAIPINHKIEVAFRIQQKWFFHKVLPQKNNILRIVHYKGTKCLHAKNSALQKNKTSSAYVSTG
jgi:hypothetical protein